MVNMELKSNEKVAITINDRPKKRRLKVGDPDFVPPDGGWGWLVVFACGFSNLSTFPMFQQFGLVFRGKFEELGISETQTTTVINLNSAFNAGMGLFVRNADVLLNFSSILNFDHIQGVPITLDFCIKFATFCGLLNGPLFRRFTYRQVAMFGSCLVAGSLMLCALSQSFWAYLIFYSMCYGSGIGITQSSNALALNTYFKEKRRIATGFSWTTTALGPMVWPYIIVVLNATYGMEGTLLLFAGFSLHSFVCSLLLQPVEWHTEFKVENPEKSLLLEVPENKHHEGKISRKGSHSVFSSQYLRNEDDPIHTGYEITDPGTPMMVRSNDGWYSQSRSQIGSRVSLSSSKGVKSGQNSVGVSKRPSYNNLVDHGRDHRKRERKLSQTKQAIREEVEDPGNDIKAQEKLPLKVQDADEYPNEKDVLNSAAIKLAEYKQNETKELTDDEKIDSLSIWKKIAIFFDFELFKDPIYVNLMLGITVANFAELNFSILTPIVLEEFHFGKYEIATFMSLLGATDIVVRFFIPFVADKIGWSNKTFFLLGVMSMAIGRIILVHTQTYGISLLVAVIIGAGKGFRTIFMALVIPSYVTLERLPAASGLQLATSGLLFIILGPLVGWIREAVSNYVITLHILNICTYSTAIAWTIEELITRKCNRATTPEKSNKS